MIKLETKTHKTRGDDQKPTQLRNVSPNNEKDCHNLASATSPIAENPTQGTPMNQMSVLLAILFAVLNLADAGAAERAPNIVFIMADDLGIGEVGCYGGKAIPTPNIDGLAVEGLRFTNAYSASAVCAPTRCGLMTGLHMGHAIRRANGSKSGEVPLKPEDVT